jgi:uncharacterized protein (TIGR00251 family)
MKGMFARLEVQIQPGASKNKIISFENNILKMKISANPVEGKANQKLVDFLSDILDIAKSNITIKVGLTSKRKMLEINDIA